MAKIRVGNKANSVLNGEWAKHAKKRLGEKRITSGKRRCRDKQIIREALIEISVGWLFLDDDFYELYED